MWWWSLDAVERWCVGGMIAGGIIALVGAGILMVF
jgi:hypothetical protein